MQKRSEKLHVEVITLVIKWLIIEVLVNCTKTVSFPSHKTFFDSCISKVVSRASNDRFRLNRLVQRNNLYKVC